MKESLYACLYIWKKKKIVKRYEDVKIKNKNKKKQSWKVVGVLKSGWWSFLS